MVECIDRFVRNLKLGDFIIISRGWVILSYLIREFMRGLLVFWEVCFFFFKRVIYFFFYFRFIIFNMIIV